MTEELSLGQSPPGYRSGFVSVVGRPNVGKSTLLNQILRAKVAITSPRPQTTRNAIRGVYTSETAQLIFVDTPGFHKPKTALGRRLNAVVRTTLEEVDVVAFVVDAAAGIGRGDTYIAEMLDGVATPIVAVLNKVDLVANKAELLPQLERVQALGEFRAYVPVSAKTGDGVAEVVAELVELMPPGPLYYPPDATTDQPEAQLIAELVREKALHLTREELPHSIAVVVEEITPREDEEIVDIYATIYVERRSQKGIVIGKGGQMLREIGTQARREIEGLLGSRVYLDLKVGVEPDWQKHETLVDRFGYGV